MCIRDSLNIMKNSLTSILLISIGILNSQLKEVLPEEIGVSSERIKLITDLSEDYIKSNKVTGIVNIISRKGKIVYFEASGNRGIDDNTPMKKNDLFRIYSCLLYTSPSPRDVEESRMPSSA